jgi:hypothetical protein
LRDTSFFFRTFGLTDFRTTQKKIWNIKIYPTIFVDIIGSDTKIILRLPADLIYKEAARDQAQLPAGNPSNLKKVPIPVPANNTGEYKFNNMKILKTILQNIFRAPKSPTPAYCYSYANKPAYMCCGR